MIRGLFLREQIVRPTMVADMTYATIPLVAFAVFAAAAVPYSLGEEQFGNAPVEKNDDWAEGVVTVTNDLHRVYRRWVNGNEEFFFKGDANAINAALARFAQIKARVREVVLLPFLGSTRSFGDKPVAHDWRLYVPSGLCLSAARSTPSPMQPVEATLTVHVSDAVQLGHLDFPAGVYLVGPDELASRYRMAAAGLVKPLRRLAASALEQLEAKVRATPVLDALREHTHATRGVDLEVEYDAVSRRFRGALVNRRRAPVTIVVPGDGSEAGMRTPHTRWEITDPGTGENKGIGWIGCGTINSMRPEEIVTLQPGQRRSFVYWKAVPPPGRYRVVVHYDNDPTWGDAAAPATPILALIRRSDRLVLTSKAIEITVR